MTASKASAAFLEPSMPTKYFIRLESCFLNNCGFLFLIRLLEVTMSCCHIHLCFFSLSLSLSVCVCVSVCHSVSPQNSRQSGTKIRAAGMTAQPIFLPIDLESHTDYRLE